MIPRTPQLPPGRCLTDVWPHLRPEDRRYWLRVVQAEAVDVTREAAAYRCQGRRTSPLTPRQASEAWELEHREAARRRAWLDQPFRPWIVRDLPPSRDGVSS